MEPPKNHPRYRSLMTRELLVKGLREGLVTEQGLIAHGRGEAFDYLLGERTTEPAGRAIEAAASMLLLSERPVISVNGNVAALVLGDLMVLSDILDCPVEVNLFHRTEERVKRIADRLREVGCRKVLGEAPDRKLPGLDHPRALCSSEGIFISDTVLVPLEDGDRCELLKKGGKRVITVDLNPLSRTARTADITIVDNIVRAVPALSTQLRSLKLEGIKEEGLRSILSNFDNGRNLEHSLDIIRGNRS